jgi:uracil-DNA glycosylase family 4
MGDGSGLGLLAREVINCRKCPRLRSYCESVGVTKRKAFREWNYWKKPLPGFGDTNARLLVIGLAPAANGGTRTGRLFCGDSSGDWVIRALHETNFANQSVSRSREDGLKLKGAYLSAVVRCAPPENKPTREEITNCLHYLEEELGMLRNVEIVLVLGKIAFDGYIQILQSQFGFDTRPEFHHGAIYSFGNKFPKLFVSYHPSRRNTQTGILTWPMWIRTFRKIRRALDRR